jgi:predicted hotdog family 3-hydroxylacyl-ACP dehydratase
VQLTGETICARIPHTGAMCLLAAVRHWDAATIRCTASSHRTTTNPLRSAGRLPAIAAVEYAAQAMAIHGALLGGDEPAARSGYLAALRQIKLHVDRLDGLTDDLDVEATRLDGDAHAFMYAFTVSAAGALLAEGRALVVHPKGETE